MPRNQRPFNAEKIETYEDLRFYARKFGLGFYNCLIFIGPPGRLKSSILEQETKGEAHLISGHATPFKVFCEAQEHANQLLILDDADGLYKEATGQRLLKNLTNPKLPKTVMWMSGKPESMGLLKKFETTSKVCIIDNAWNNQNEHIRALEDRSRIFLFDPPPHEVHQEMSDQDWFNDEEIYQFIGDNLCFFKELSVRSYVKAEEAKRAGEDWREFLLQQAMDGKDLQLILIEYDEEWKNQSVDQKCKEWIRRTGGSRATYYNRKKSFLKNRMPGHPLVGRWSLDK